MADVLREAGHEVEMFADNTVDISRKIYKPRELTTYLREREDILIYHYAIGWDIAMDVLRSTPAKRVIRYHNITPPHFFADYSQDHFYGCDTGRASISDMVNLKCELYMGASAYNVQDLVDHGLDPARSAVVPPFNRLSNLLNAQADKDFIQQYQDGAVSLLMVGRISPNKGHLALIDAFACYQREFEKNSRLFIIGKQDKNLHRYNQQIQERIRRYGLTKQVVMVDNATEAQLKAAYQISDALLMLSEHEGFCVPLVEAMALQVPIVAYGSSAIPETVGDAGLVWESNDPMLMACSIDRILHDKDLKKFLQTQGAERYQSTFTREAIKQTLLKVIARL